MRDTFFFSVLGRDSPRLERAELRLNFKWARSADHPLAITSGLAHHLVVRREILSTEGAGNSTNSLLELCEPLFIFFCRRRYGHPRIIFGS